MSEVKGNKFAFDKSTKKIPVVLKQEIFKPTKILETKGFIKEIKDKGEIIRYAPIKDGFLIENGEAYFNRPIIYRQSIITTGHKPMVGMSTHTQGGYLLHGRGRYPILGKDTLKPDEYSIKASHPSLGKLRIGFARKDKSKWLDNFEMIKASFIPGITEYNCYDEELGIKVKFMITSLLLANGMICNIEISSELNEDVEMVWMFGNLSVVDSSESKRFPIEEICDNNVDSIGAGMYRLVSSTMPSTEVYAASDFSGQSNDVVIFNSFKDSPLSLKKNQPEGIPVACTNIKLSKEKIMAGIDGHIVCLWGVDGYDVSEVDNILQRFAPRESLNAKWSEYFKKGWFETYIGRALQPKKKIEFIMNDVKEEFHKAEEFWTTRTSSFQIETPDHKLNSLAGWVASTTDYNYQPPSHYNIAVGGSEKYGHISVGWYGKQDIGDHQQIEETLRCYGAFNDKGRIRRFTADMSIHGAEHKNTYWLDQVHHHFMWTGNLEFIKDLWTTIKSVVEWELNTNDPDNDGLFRAPYEFWNADAKLKGPKACVESCLAANMLVKAAELGKYVGDVETAEMYLKLANRTKEKILKELWVEDKGVLSSVYPHDVRQETPEAYEEFLSVLYGDFTETQAYTMLRFVRDNLWTKTKYGNTIQWVSNWWPLQWSHHWVGLGDTLLAVLASTYSGDIDNYYEVLKGCVETAYMAYKHSPITGFSNVLSDEGIADGQTDSCESNDSLLRAIVEGLFGIHPQINEQKALIKPCFPSDWENASIKTLDFECVYQKNNDQMKLAVKSVKALKKTIKLGVRSGVKRVLLNGVDTEYDLDAGVNRCYVVVETEQEHESNIVIELESGICEVQYPKEVTINEPVVVNLMNVDYLELNDPQKVVSKEKRNKSQIQLTPQRIGFRTVFLKLYKDNISFYQPLDLIVKEKYWLEDVKVELSPMQVKYSIIRSQFDEESVLVETCFGGEKISQHATFKHGKCEVDVKLSDDCIKALSPGNNYLEVSLGREKVIHKVIDWDVLKTEEAVDRFSKKLVLLDLDKYYNDSIDTFWDNRFVLDVHFHSNQYSRPQWLSAPGVRIPACERELMAGDIPFLTGGRTIGVHGKHAGNWSDLNMDMINQNMLVLTCWKPYQFPSSATLWVQNKIEKMYLLMMNYLSPMKCYVPNAEIVVYYENGEEEITPLTPPYNIDSYYEHFSTETMKVDLGLEKIKIDGLSTIQTWEPHADVIDIMIKKNCKVERIEIRSVCSENIIGILGVTLLLSDGDKD